MSYHLKSSRRPQKGKRFVWTVLIILISLSLAVPGFFFSISTMFAKGSLSIKDRVVSGYEISLSYFTSRNELVRQNDRLLSIANEVEGYKIKNEVLLIENETLKNIQTQNDSSKVIAQVITAPPQTAFDIMVIEADSNISVGNKVKSPSGTLIGEIIETSGKQAKVKLLSAPKNTFTVENIRTNERYDLEGRSAGNYSVSLPKETDIETEDILIIRQSGEILPVARVGEIEIRDSSPFLIAFAISPASISSLGHVIVVSGVSEEVIEE